MTEFLEFGTKEAGIKYINIPYPLPEVNELISFHRNELVFRFLDLLGVLKTPKERRCRTSATYPYAISGLFRDVSGACVGSPDLSILHNREPNGIFAVINFEVRSSEDINMGSWTGTETIVNRTYASLLGTSAKVALAVFNGAFKLFWKSNSEDSCRIFQYPSGDKIAHLNSLSEKEYFLKIVHIFAKFGQFREFDEERPSSTHIIKTYSRSINLNDGSDLKIHCANLLNLEEQHQTQFIKLLDRVYRSQKR
jgi:hypothetical protein